MLAEELGFVGCTIVIVLFAILIWRGIITAIKAPDLFGTLVATGITSLIAVQVIINIGVVSGVFPVTGVALPFFSYGGTSLIVTMASIGILVNIGRQGEREIQKKILAGEQPPSSEFSLESQVPVTAKR